MGLTIGFSSVWLKQHMSADAQKSHVCRKCARSVDHMTYDMMWIQRTHLGVVCSEWGFQVKPEFLLGSCQTINDTDSKLCFWQEAIQIRNGVSALIRILSTCYWQLWPAERMDAKQEVLDILQKIWTKLQTLPEANSIDVGGFLILLLFVCKCHVFEIFFLTHLLDIE